MALRPKDEKPEPTKEERQQAAQEEALLREVDEAVRHDTVLEFLQKYGKMLVTILVAGLAAFAVYLWWDGQNSKNLEAGSEELVKALDQLEAGNRDTADSALDTVIADGNSGAATIARLVKAGIALQDNREAEALALFEEVAADGDAPEELRQLANLRAVAVKFDEMEPQEVIDRLKELATPGNPWFPSAGEMTAMAYLEQGKPELAGPIFAAISRDERAPQSIRSRTRQMAGLLGVDAVDDIEEAIGEVTQEAQAR